MDLLLLAGRLVVAAVFLVAASAKLADRRGSRQALAEFGVPGRLVPALAVLVPLAELATAALLIPTATAWWGAVAALALLVLFSAVIGFNLARGRRPDCHCFGQLHSKPVGWRTLARNGFLAAAAGLVVLQGRADPGASAVAWLGDLTAAELVTVVSAALLLLAVAAEAVFLLNLLRQNGRLLLRIEVLESRLGIESTGEPERPQPGLPVGSPAPGFQLSGLYGETLTLDALRAGGRPVMLFFTDPNCGPCNALLPEIAQWQRAHGDLTTAVISRGTTDENRPKTTEHGLTSVLLQQDREIAEAYGETGTPAAVVVNQDGTIGSSLAAGADAIRALVGRTVGVEAAAAAPAAPAAHNGSGDAAAIAAGPQPVDVGDPAPPLRLRDLGGRTVNLAGFRGSRAAVLFWDPGCGFCSQILDDLKRWEAESAPEPKLIVVSAGDAATNRAMGLRAPVVLDEGFSVGRSFGANGTPSAILVDEEGRIASQLAVGGPGVLALLGASPSGNGAQPAPAAAVGRGDEAPAFELPDLEGETVALADFRGKEILLLFWNPGCGFCRQMVEDLNAWDAARGSESPEILVVSTGTVEANRDLGVNARMVLDQSFTVASAFGANGTPMAVLLDAEGKIASDLAGGGPGVLALARGEQPASV